MSRKGEVVSNSKSIAVNYLKGWFFVDLVAALPFDFLYASDVYSGEVSNSITRITPHALSHARLFVKRSSSRFFLIFFFPLRYFIPISSRKQNFSLVINEKHPHLKKIISKLDKDKRLKRHSKHCPPSCSPTLDTTEIKGNSVTFYFLFTLILSTLRTRYTRLKQFHQSSFQIQWRNVDELNVREM